MIIQVEKFFFQGHILAAVYGFGCSKWHIAQLNIRVGYQWFRHILHSPLHSWWFHLHRHCFHYTRVERELRICSINKRNICSGCWRPNDGRDCLYWIKMSFSYFILMSSAITKTRWPYSFEFNRSFCFWCFKKHLFRLFIFKMTIFYRRKIFKHSFKRIVVYKKIIKLF